MDTAAIKSHAIQSLINLLSLIILILCLITEAHIFINKMDPKHHLFPISCILLLPAALRLSLSPSKTLFLLDFACLHPSPRLRVPTACFLEHISIIDRFPEESISFMSKIISSSSLGEETYLPPPLHYIPPSTHHQHSIQEAHLLLFPVLDDLLSKTNISPRDIDILIVNCSGFCPSPSLTSIVANRYSLRDDIKTFNVSGMGCSAAAIGIDIARNLLKAHADSSYAVIISTEILSNGWYAGKDRRKLLLNCFFRMGSSAVLVTNRRAEKRRSKYRLLHLQRTQRAFDDASYLSAIREEDADGITGFTVERYLPRVAAETLRANLVPLGAAILPWHEKLRYAAAMWVCGRSGCCCVVPEFGRVIRHYCLPGSGRAVIEEIGKGLRLGRREMEAALAVFRMFGNQSSASMWYQLEYIEGKGSGVRKGERVLQLAMGSGPKCNSLVWESLGKFVG